MNLIKTLITVTLALASAFAFAAVEVNNANQAQLETIKGVGPAMSGKILEARKSGAFKSWPDLVERVKGIGDANAGKFSDAGLIVNGTAYAHAPAVAQRDAGKAGPKKATVEPGRK
jgi:competence protein ComEA